MPSKESVASHDTILANLTHSAIIASALHRKVSPDVQEQH